MNRRTALQTTAATLLTAGCLGSAPPTGEPTIDESTANDTPSTDSTTQPNVTSMIDTDRVDDTTFRQTGRCTNSGSATVEFAARQATISGCLTAHNGCAEPVLDSVADTDEGRLQVIVGEEDRSDPDTLCTQALVDRGYELTLSFAADRPTTIEVVHDDARGRTVVARVDRP